MKAPERYMTSRELADLLQVNINTVYNLIDRRQIPFLKVGKQYRFRESEIRKWLQQQGVALEEIGEPTRQRSLNIEGVGKVMGSYLPDEEEKDIN